MTLKFIIFNFIEHFTELAFTMTVFDIAEQNIRFYWTW